MLNLLAAIDKPFIPAWSELRPFAPELWLIAAIVGVLLAPFFSVRKSNAVGALVALVGLGLALVSAIAVGTSEGVVGSHLRGLLVVDQMAVMWKILLLIFAIGIVGMWISTTAAIMHEGDGPEFFTLLLGATLGMSLMGSTSNLLMIFMGGEREERKREGREGGRKKKRRGEEASLKYVLFGAATSAVMVYGLSMLYGLYGTLQVSELASKMASGGAASAALLSVAFAGLLIGIGFKISAVPLHFWCPDVFEGASIDVSAFLSVASKGAALVLLMRVLMTVSAALGYQNAAGVSLTAMAVVIGVLGSVTATVGNTAAFVQNNIKRLLAYSSIAHAGYMLCALSLLVSHNEAPAAAAGGGVVSAQAASVLLLYLAVYLFMNLGAFTVAGVIAAEVGSEDINDYAALGRRNPLLALCMSVFMFSLVGLPPFAGFVAKLMVMYVLGSNGGWWWALVAVIGINTVFSLYYYARVIRVMYLVPSDKPAISPNPLGAALGVFCAAMLLIMFVGFGRLNGVASNYGKVFTGSVASQATAMVEK